MSHCELPPTDWSWVEDQRRASFHGHGAVPDEDTMRRMEKALKEDPERYRRIGEQIRREYRDSLRGW